jgi:hypothetical protein
MALSVQVVEGTARARKPLYELRVGARPERGKAESGDAKRRYVRRTGEKRVRSDVELA